MQLAGALFEPSGGSYEFFPVAEALPLRSNLAARSKPPNAKATGYMLRKL